jgi:hypothetical protein
MLPLDGQSVSGCSGCQKPIGEAHGMMCERVSVYTSIVQPEDVRDYSAPPNPLLPRASDRLYDVCAQAIRSGRIDARSPIGDATLDYRQMRWPEDS